MHTCILETKYSSYMFRLILQPPSGRNITADGCIRIEQNFVNKCKDVK